MGTGEHQRVGGDPDNVTIGGESAGNRSIAVYLVSPPTKGLFHQAVMQSGSAVGGWALDIALLEGEKSGTAFIDLLGTKTLEELRRMPEEDLLACYEINKIRNIYVFIYIDSYVCKDEPCRIFQDGGEHKVPILNGSMKNEGNLDCIKLKASDYVQDICRLYGVDANACLFVYLGRTEEEVAVSIKNMTSDMFFIGHRIMSYFHHKVTGKSVYQYLFAKVPPGRESEYYGAFHTVEIAYIFRNLDYIDRPWKKNDYDFSIIVTRYWTNFIKTGDPNGSGLPGWDVCLSKHEPVMLLGDETGMMSVPNADSDVFCGRSLF